MINNLTIGLRNFIEVEEDNNDQRRYDKDYDGRGVGGNDKRYHFCTVSKWWQGL